MMSIVPYTARPTRDRQADNLAAAIANGGNPMQRTLNASAIIIIEFAQLVDQLAQVSLGDLGVSQFQFFVDVAGGGLSSEIKHDFQKSAGFAILINCAANPRRQVYC